MASKPVCIRPGDEAYGRLVSEEIAHYSKIYEGGRPRETLREDDPPAWLLLSHWAGERFKARTGMHLREKAVERFRRPGARVLSLGCGPGGNELSLAQAAPGADILGLDLNPHLLELGRQRARALGLNVRFEQADLNTVELEASSYDVVMCFASLHHVIELERLAVQIKKALRPGGELFVEDVIARNGYLLWPETRRFLRYLWRALPARYRVNHTAYPAPRVDDEIWEPEPDTKDMECIRSGEILPVLERTFSRVHSMPHFTICRRLCDTMYGPNYDVRTLQDRAVLRALWQLDLALLVAKRLRPDSLFAIYRRESSNGPPTACARRGARA